MLRKSILFVSFASLASIAALITWGLAPGGSTTACASGTSATNQCNPRVTLATPGLIGTVTSPVSARVAWSVPHVPPCYQLTRATVTFKVSRNNAPDIERVVVIENPNSTNNITVAPLGLGSNLPIQQRPNAIIAEVRVEARPINPNRAATEASTATLPPN